MSQYRALDPITEGPQVMGPSRDWNAIAKRERVWRQEMPYNVRPQRLPVTLQMPMARPQVSKPVLGGLKPGRLPVLIRNSNINPQASGQGVGHSSWSVSDPYWAHTQPGRATVAGLGVAQSMITDVSLPAPILPVGTMAPPLPPTSMGTGLLAIIGVALGGAAWFMLRKRA